MIYCALKWNVCTGKQTKSPQLLQLSGVNCCLAVYCILQMCFCHSWSSCLRLLVASRTCWFWTCATTVWRASPTSSACWSISKHSNWVSTSWKLCPPPWLGWRSSATSASPTTGSPGSPAASRGWTSWRALTWTATPSSPRRHPARSHSRWRRRFTWWRRVPCVRAVWTGVRLRGGSWRMRKRGRSLDYWKSTILQRGREV